MKRVFRYITTLSLTGFMISSLTISARSVSRSSANFRETVEADTTMRLLGQESVPLWQRILRGERGKVSRNPNAGTYLNENLCAVSPNGGSVKTWSSQPLFIWLDKTDAVDRIEVYSEDSWEPIWSIEAGTGTSAGWHIISPSGLQLEEEKTYYFAFRMADDEGRPSASELINFELMPADERSDIEAALTSAGVSGEESSWEALQVFGEQSTSASNHFLDMARILFSMPESAERDAYIDDIFSYYCQSDE